MKPSRIVVPFLLILLLSLLSIAVSAQDALPLPAPDAVSVRVGAPDASSPADGVTVTPNTIFYWTNTGADEYRLSLKVLATGQVFNLRYDAVTEVGCSNPDCGVSMSLDDPKVSAFWDAVKTGSQVKWWVTAFHDVSSLKVKGKAETFIAQESTVPTLIAPAADAVLFSATNLTWTKGAIYGTYTLIVKNAATKLTVYKQSIGQSICSTPCGLNPFGDPDLVPGGEYIWLVKFTSDTGEKAKSVKRRFSIGNVRG